MVKPWFKVIVMDMKSSARGRKQPKVKNNSKQWMDMDNHGGIRDYCLWTRGYLPYPLDKGDLQQKLFSNKQTSKLFV